MKGTRNWVPQLGALSHTLFGWEGSPTKIDYRKKRKNGTLILTSLLEDLGKVERKPKSLAGVAVEAVSGIDLGYI